MNSVFSTAYPFLTEYLLRIFGCGHLLKKTSKGRGGEASCDNVILYFDVKKRLSIEKGVLPNCFFCILTFQTCRFDMFAEVGKGHCVVYYLPLLSREKRQPRNALLLVSAVCIVFSDNLTFFFLIKKYIVDRVSFFIIFLFFFPTLTVTFLNCLMGHKESKGLSKQAPAPTMKEGIHYVFQNSLYPPFPDGSKSVMFGMGCFWCSENLFMNLKSGIISTHVGYAGGKKENPTYRDICTGQTGHAEVTRVIFDPTKIKFVELLKIFWETHDPTTLNQQGGDVGTQYRSCIFVDDPDLYKEAQKSKEIYGQALTAAGHKPIVTEIVSPAPKFWYAEDDHQQYDKKPNSRQYCGLRPLGVGFPSASM